MIRLLTDSTCLALLLFCSFLVYNTQASAPYVESMQHAPSLPPESSKTYIINVTITQTARGTSNTTAEQPTNLELSQQNPSQKSDVTAIQTPPEQSSSWWGTCAKILVGTAAVGAVVYGGVAYLGVLYVCKEKMKALTAGVST